MISFYLVSPENRCCIKPEITRTDNWKILTIFGSICLYSRYKLVRFKLYTFEILKVRISIFGLHHQVRHVKWVRKSQKWNHVSSHDCIVSIFWAILMTNLKVTKRSGYVWNHSKNHFRLSLATIYFHQKSNFGPKSFWVENGLFKKSNCKCSVFAWVFNLNPELWSKINYVEKRINLLRLPQK